MNLKTNLTTVNFKKGRIEGVRYIVIHFTANDGDTDEGNAKYFNSVNRKASAHYFVDEDSVTKVVKDEDTAWHCGDTQKYNNDGATYKNLCSNNNSIGVEMCSDKIRNSYVITKETQKNTIELVRMLMKKHNVPIENVIRHYDVTGKICPEPFVKSATEWTLFKAELTTIASEEKEIIQAKCGFGNPLDVWRLLDKHPFAADLYKKWAASYK